MKILFQTSKRNTLFIRGYTKLLNFIGYDYRFEDKLTEEDIKWSDVVVCVRPTFPHFSDNLEYAKNIGKRTAVFFDDNLASKQYPFPWERRLFIRCLKTADAFIGCNINLLQNCQKQYNKNAKIITVHTVIEKTDIVKTVPDKEKVRIVYAAGRDHLQNVKKFLFPILDEFFDTYSDKADLTFIGVCPDISSLRHKDSIRQVPFMNLHEYDKYMANNHFDIGLAPLEDTEFCNGKYFNKYLEYSKCGIYGLYSDCLPYTLIIKDGENGDLVGTSPEDWIKKMSYAVDNIGQIRLRMDSIQKDLLERFSLESIARHFEEDLISLSKEETCTAKPIIKMHRHILRNKLFLLYHYGMLFIYSAKNTGLKNSLKSVYKRVFR